MKDITFSLKDVQALDIIRNSDSLTEAEKERYASLFEYGEYLHVRLQLKDGRLQGSILDPNGNIVPPVS